MTRMWALGFIAGVAALVIIEFMLVLGVAAVVGVALLRPRPAAAAGVCVSWGAGFLIGCLTVLYLIWRGLKYLGM